MSKKGYVSPQLKEKMERQKSERLGLVTTNRFGTLVKIVEYNSSADIVVEFQDEYKYRKHTTWDYFIKRQLPNPYDKEVCGVAYMGENTWAKSKGKVNKIHDIWIQMIRRCYDEKAQEKQITYKDCTVCDEWLCFANYEKWYKDNFYQVDGQTMCVDKDILYKGNEIYSPQTCCIVPMEINNQFIKNKKVRGEYPIGVRILNSGSFQSCSGIKNLETRTFKTAEEAFYDYKQQKEDYLKQLADKYKGIIPDNVYDALYNYQVEITN